jgi:tagatose-1,6-bisphosphate aldolase
VAEAVRGCREAGLALILEPIVYKRDGEERAGGDRFAELVVEGAGRLAALEPDVLKLQYPGSAEGCAALDAACGTDVPWVLLGGGADAAVLEGQIEDACRAGASGFIVGRTLFDAALVEDEEASDRALHEQCRPLLERLAATAERLAQPWRDRVGALPAPADGWYR